MSIRSLKHNRGFSMIEVLVSTFILAVGLLGLAALQLNSMKVNQGAFNRSQASILASDILDRMRANREAYLAGAYDDVDTSDSPPPAQSCIADDAAAATGCNNTQLADQDIRDWTGYFNDIESAGTDFVPLIPGGVGTIERDAGKVTVIITWQQDEWADSDGTMAKEPAEQTFSVSVRI